MVIYTAVSYNASFFGKKNYNVTKIQFFEINIMFFFNGLLLNQENKNILKTKKKFFIIKRFSKI